MDPAMAEGLRIMAVGIAGVFGNLLILMIVVNLLGVALGKRKKKSEKQATGSAGDAG